MSEELFWWFYAAMATAGATLIWGFGGTLLVVGVVSLARMQKR